MVLTALANHPQTSPAVLHLLTGIADTQMHAAFGPGSTGIGPGRLTAFALARALVVNPHTDLEDVRTLLAHRSTTEPTSLACAYVSHPDVGVADVAVALAVGTGRTSPRPPRTATLRTALRSARDLDGSLARYALEHGGDGKRILQELLHNASAPDDVRLAAGLRLGAQPLSTDRDIDDVVAVARDYPEHLEAFLRAAAGHQHLDALEALAEQVQDGTDLAEGTPAWFACRRVSVDMVLEFLHEKPVVLWRRALKFRPDPDGVLGEAALAVHPHDPYLVRRLTADAFPDRIRRAAIRALAGIGSPVGDWGSQFTDAIASAPLGVLEEFAPCVNHSTLTMAYIARPDLTSTILDTLTVNRCTWGQNRAYVGDDQRSLGSQLVWGLVLLTHPGASPEQRRQGFDLVQVGASVAEQDASRSPFVAARGSRYSEHARAIAQVAASSATRRDMARALPVSALTDPVVRGLPTLGALLAVAVDDALAGVGDQEGALTALAALADQFDGTVQELFDTAHTIAM